MSTQLDKPTLDTDDPLVLAELLLPIQPDDHVEGPDDAVCTVVEYGDYECPACGKLFAIIRQLHDESDTPLRLVFRHYPVSGRHPQAQLAAEAAEAAGAQGKFWQMHELLFQHQDALAEKDLLAYAGLAGLDVERVRQELKERTWEDRVREDFKRGVSNGVYGTPGLFLNGIRYNGPLDRELIEKAIAG